MGFLFNRQEKEEMMNQSAIAECEAQLEKLGEQKKEAIFRIGEKYVEDHTSEDAAGTEYEADLAELGEITKEMAFTEKRKLALQRLRKCEKCGNILVIDSAFCNKCGEKLEPMQAELMKNICPQCGGVYEDGAVFCTMCGNKL